MAQGTPSPSALEAELTKLSSPRIFLVRMLVFLVLCALLLVVLYKQIVLAFFANPGLNALIGAVLAIGIILSFRQVIRLYPEVAWVNNFRIADPGLALDRRPTLLAPMAAILGGERTGRMAISQQTMRHLLDSIATRLDEARDISRYMTGLLVFLGLLGTFWGLIETVGSVGHIIDGLKVGGDAGSLFDTLKEGLAAPLGGMGISFSSSLFGLAGSLILGFLDLQSSQAQNRFYTDLEDWLATTVREYIGEGASPPPKEIQTAMERLRTTVEEMGSARGTTAAMANLADAIQSLVAHMRNEQQMIREWADGQGEQNREIRKLLERLARQPEKKLAVELDMLDHVTIGVTDIERTKTFYDQALHPLGITRLYGDGERYAGYGVKPKAFFWVGLREASQTGAHIAFAAADRAAVDRFYHEAIAAGGKDNGPPGPRPNYHADYYGAFVLDPDGHNIEAVCRNPQG